MTRGKAQYPDTVAILSTEDEDTQIEVGRNSPLPEYAYPIYVAIAPSQEWAWMDTMSVGLSVADAKDLRDELDKVIAQFEAVQHDVQG